VTRRRCSRYIQQMEHQAVFLRISTTESPRKNILLMNRSLFIGFLFLPFGCSVHISFTFSRTMLQCLSNAFTLAKSFLLFRREIRICVWFRTDCCNTDRGPWLILSPSRSQGQDESICQSAKVRVGRGTDPGARGARNQPRSTLGSPAICAEPYPNTRFSPE